MRFLVPVLFAATLILAVPQLPTPIGPPPPLSPPPSSSAPPTSHTSKASTPTVSTPASTTAAAPDGPICECGYTYCGSVLMGMKKPWNQKQLSEAYCATPNAACSNSKPTSDIQSALFLCLCNAQDQKVGNTLDLICGCDKCLNVGPDNRARCETPCVAAHKAK